MSVCRSRTATSPLLHVSKRGRSKGVTKTHACHPAIRQGRPARLEEAAVVVDTAGASILVFGVIVLIAAFSTTNASAVNDEFLPSGTATSTLSCGGNDAVNGVRHDRHPRRDRS